MSPELYELVLVLAVLCLGASVLCLLAALFELWWRRRN